MKTSIVIPFHWMKNWQGYLPRCLRSIEKQSFKDYEIILMKIGSMPVTSNAVLKAAQGELVKIIYMDDYFAHGDALQEIVTTMDSWPDAKWLVSGCVHDHGDGKHVNYHSPSFNDRIQEGANTIGSPSVLTMRRDSLMLFDEELSWLLDCDLYRRLYDTYGPPVILDTPNIAIGIHSGQTTNVLTDEEKRREHHYLEKKYDGKTDKTM